MPPPSGPSRLPSEDEADRFFTERAHRPWENDRRFVVCVEPYG